MMGEKKNSPEWLKRWLRYFLGFDGIFHLIEMGLAIYEEAYLTAGLIGITGIMMLLASLVLSGEHKHYHLPTQNNEE